MVQGGYPESRKRANQPFRVNLPKVVHVSVNQQNRNLVPIEAVGILVTINVDLDEHSLAWRRRELPQDRLNNVASIITQVAPPSADQRQCVRRHNNYSQASPKNRLSMT